MAYLVACFPRSGDFLSNTTLAVFRRKLEGRDRDDVVRAIDIHAEHHEHPSIKGLMEGVAAAGAERRRAEEERLRDSRRKLPPPPPPPESHRSKVRLAAQGVYALAVIRIAEHRDACAKDPTLPRRDPAHIYPEREAETDHAFMMDEEPERLAAYVHSLEVETERLGRGTLADWIPRSLR